MSVVESTDGQREDLVTVGRYRPVIESRQFGTNFRESLTDLSYFSTMRPPRLRRTAASESGFATI